MGVTWGHERTCIGDAVRPHSGLPLRWRLVHGDRKSEDECTGHIHRRPVAAGRARLYSCRGRHCSVDQHCARRPRCAGGPAGPQHLPDHVHRPRARSRPRMRPAGGCASHLHPQGAEDAHAVQVRKVRRRHIQREKEDVGARGHAVRPVCERHPPREHPHRQAACCGCERGSVPCASGAAGDRARQAQAASAAASAGAQATEGADGVPGNVHMGPRCCQDS
mmetsp:Transcript_35495/g.89191  ORF Transcript_35495/g.89191 Transcript_35495/m.89191 type:complete len:221 (-) Transcript_35495:373-1035(-)